MGAHGAPSRNGNGKMSVIITGYYGSVPKMMVIKSPMLWTFYIILWVSLNVQTKPTLWSLQLYLLLLLQQCPHLLRFMPHLQAKKRLSKGSKCWDHMIIIWSTRLSSVCCIASVRGVSKWFMMCVCVKAKKCAPDLLPAFASCPRLKKMKTDSWPQYIICNSFVIQKSGQIIAAPATVGQIQAWSRAPAEVGWMLWDISSSNPTWTSPADFGNGILQVFGLTWRDSRRKGIISSPSISCFRTKATSGGEKRGSGL